MAKNKILDITSMTLAGAGGVNWGSVALGQIFGFNGNLVNFLFGTLPYVETGVYLSVGVGTLYLIGKPIFKY